MPVRIKSLATIATALAIALAAPAAFAADQMTNDHDSSSGTTTMDKGMETAKPHAGSDSMAHPAKDKMSGQTKSGTSGDTAMSNDKMTH
jgi:hypothetical protein